MNNNQVIQDEKQKAKGTWGGARKRAGRESLGSKIIKDPRYLAARGVHPLMAAEILEQIIDEGATWRRILTSDDDRVVLSAMQFLTQMRDGKAAQHVSISSTNITLAARDVESAREIAQEMRLELESMRAELNPSNEIASNLPQPHSSTQLYTQTAPSDTLTQVSVTNSDLPKE